MYNNSVVRKRTKNYNARENAIMKKERNTPATNTSGKNYPQYGGICFVRNAGAAFAEAVYTVNDDICGDIILKFEAVTPHGTITEIKEFQPSSENNEVTAKIDLKNSIGSVVLKSALYRKSDDTPITDICQRAVELYGNFADTSDIKLEKDSMLEKSVQVGLDYVLSINVDRLLAPSYEMHNLTPPGGAVRYGGWERKSANNWHSSPQTMTLAGHSLGHWMSAAAVFCKETKNDQLAKMLDYAVKKLDELQHLTGSGYIGGCEDACFKSLFGGNTRSWAAGYWVPWYGIHKIYQGLLDAYDYTENLTAYKVLKKFADWAVDGTDNLTDEQMQEMLEVEYGGMNEIFARMYEITGEEKYLLTARRFTHDKILDPLIQNTDSLSGLHANTQIPKIIGAAEIYEQNPSEFECYRNAARSFMNFVVNNRSYAIGGNSIAEHFEALGAESLGVKTCESCNTYNMMRLAEHLFAWEHSCEYMDWYEHALYNHILGQQDPDTGAKMYFVSLLQGHHRVYEIKDESWWCCTGTGMENPGRYTRCTYFEDGNSLYVNLYMPNEFTWKSKGLAFKTETAYPYSESVNMTVTKGNSNAEICLRAPKWLKSPMTVSVGGDVYSSCGGEYLKIRRTWNTGDVIDIAIPMQIRTHSSKSHGQIAYLYGPLALAADCGSLADADGVHEYISNETIIDSVTADVPYIITNGKDTASLVSVHNSEKREFIIKGENLSDRKDRILKPFHEIHHRFHNVYWNIDNDGGAYEKKLNDITVDRVEPDGQQDELGHGLNCKSSVNGNVTLGTKLYYTRSAYGSAEAYFEYTLGVNRDKQNYLFVRTLCGDGLLNGYKRNFSIMLNGNVIASRITNTESDERTCDTFYKLPSELTSNLDNITVRFSPQDENSTTGSILELRITSADLSEN